MSGLAIGVLLWAIAGHYAYLVYLVRTAPDD